MLFFAWFFMQITLMDAQSFIITWQTDLPGVSCNSCITLPTEGTGYNYSVDWDNNGSIDQAGITGDITHDFGAPGTYTIRISGSFPRIYFNNSGDAKKLVSIDQWGDILWTSMEKAFAGCINMESNASDSPELNFVSSTAWMFENCSLFNGEVAGWDVSKVSDMTGMFSGTSSFDRSLGTWNLKSNVLMLHFLDNSGISCENYDNTLIGWYENPQTPLAIFFGAAGVHYFLSNYARANMLTPLCSGGMGWEIFGDSYEECDYFIPFVTKWNTMNDGTSCPSCITVPASGGGYSYDVDWNNDGTFDQLGLTGSVTHNFGLPGIYKIRIRGEFPRIFFNGQGDSEKLISIEQWGSVGWLSMENAFKGCSNLEIKALDFPDLSAVSSMSGMFAGCASLNSDLSEWDVSNVTDMSFLFSGASAFDQFLGSWDVGNVTNMEGMFAGAALFDQPLASWDVSRVVNMSGMFYNANAFSKPLSGWNVSKVTDLSEMFKGAIAFNGNLGNWTLNAEVNLSNMLDNSGMSCQNYDNTLSGWLNKSSTPDDRTFGADGVHYWLAAAQREQLIEEKGWTIIGDSEGTCDYVLPVCTSFSYPAEDQSDVKVNTGFSWVPSGLARGYKLSLGTTPGGNDVINNLDLGNVQQFQPTDMLPCGQTLYAKLTPYNLKGSAANCTELTFSTENVNATVSESNFMCEDGSLELMANGGTNYLWSPAEGLSNILISNPIATPTSTTTYSVTVSNEGRCPVNREVTVVVNQKPVTNVTATDETGNQFNDGTAVASILSGQPPFNYLWGNGSTDAAISGLAPGTYFLTVTDRNGCISSDSVVINVFECPVIGIAAEQTNVSCYGLCDGTISILSVGSAVAPIAFTWFDGTHEPIISGLCEGTYTLSLKDAKNCPAEAVFELSQPEEIVITVDQQGDETGDNNGFIVVSISDIPNLNYYWTGPNGFTSFAQHIQGLGAGCYQLVVTDTLSGCQADTTVCLEKLTSSDEIKKEILGFAAYPNPAKDLIKIDINEPGSFDVRVKLISLDGKLISSRELPYNGKTVNFDISNAKNGVYLLVLETRNGIYRQKIGIFN